MNVELENIVARFLEDIFEDPSAEACTDHGTHLRDAASRFGVDALIAVFLRHTTDSRPHIQAMAALQVLYFQGRGVPVAAAARKRAIDVLLSGLKDQRDDVCLFAAISVGGLNDVPPELVPELARLLDHPSEVVQAYCAAALPHVDARTAKAVSILGKAIESTNPHLACTAARARVRFGIRSAEAIELLVRHVRDSRSGMQVLALGALYELGTRAAAATAELLEMLRWDDMPIDLRAGIARTIGIVGAGDRQVQLELLRALRSTDWQLVWLAAISLKRHGNGKVPDEAIHTVTELFDSADINLRATAVRSLCEWRSQSTHAIVSLLRQLEREHDMDVCWLIGEALAAAGEQAVPHLIKALQPPNPRTLTVVCKALGDIGEASLEPVIRMTLATVDQSVRHIGVWLLYALGPRAAAAVPALLELIRETSDKALRCDILMALAAIGPLALSAGPELIQILTTTDDEELRLWSERALVQLGNDGLKLISEAMLASGPEARERLGKVAMLFRAHEESPKHEFEGFDDVIALEAFNAVADILSVRATSSRDLERELGKLKSAGKLSEEVFTSDGYILKVIQRLETFVARRDGLEVVRLVESAPGRKGGLTAEGERVRQQVKRVLAMKDRRVEEGT